MLEIAKKFNALLIDKIDLSPEFGTILYTIIVVTIMIVAAVFVNWLIQTAFKWLSKNWKKLKKTKWHSYTSRHNLAHHIILLLPGVIFYVLPYLTFEKDSTTIIFLHRADIIYVIIVIMMILNSLMLTFLDYYSTTDKNRSHPLKGVVQGLQVVMIFIGGIIIIAVFINKSPTVLLTGLGASAAVLMLIFKDSILGFVAGVQLSQNNMIRIGDWIQMPDGSANGNVEEITLNTVKVRNWDNTITMIPPYTLVSTPFKNWRGMQESGGRRVDKQVFIDMNTLETCTQDMIDEIRKALPIMADSPEDNPENILTNIQLYRIYIERYLRQHPDVNQDLDLIITQKEVTAYGLPIEIYFFTKEKSWALYEKKQSNIFDHLMTVAPEFGLRLYQRP